MIKHKEHKVHKGLILGVLCALCVKICPAQELDVTPLRTLTGHTGAVWSVAFSPDGRTLENGIKIVTLCCGVHDE